MDRVKRILSCLSSLVILWFHALGGIHALQTCGPLASTTFEWNYNTLDPRTSTIWEFEGIAIMSKIGEDKAEDLNNTQFKGRIAEHDGSNAGIVINNLDVADSGQYSVKVRFTSDSPFAASEDLAVDSDAVPTEIKGKRDITVDGKPLDTDEAQVIGEPGVNFTFNIKEACIPTSDINLEFGKPDGNVQTKQCKQALSCSEIYSETGDLYVDVIVPGYASKLRFPASGFYKIQEKDVSSDVRCKDRLGCIVPATVVPASVVIIVVIVVLVVLKPCRR